MTYLGQKIYKRLYKFLNICYILNIKELILLLAYYFLLLFNNSHSRPKLRGCYFFVFMYMNRVTITPVKFINNCNKLITSFISISSPPNSS